MKLTRRVSWLLHSGDAGLKVKAQTASMTTMLWNWDTSRHCPLDGPITVRQLSTCLMHTRHTKWMHTRHTKWKRSESWRIHSNDRRQANAHIPSVLDARKLITSSIETSPTARTLTHGTRDKNIRTQRPGGPGGNRLGLTPWCTA